jgi:hypothetical protein
MAQLEVLLSRSPGLSKYYSQLTVEHQLDYETIILIVEEKELEELGVALVIFNNHS